MLTKKTFDVRYASCGRVENIRNGMARGLVMLTVPSTCAEFLVSRA
jgi:hypothetical protein